MQMTPSNNYGNNEVSVYHFILCRTILDMLAANNLGAIDSFRLAEDEWLSEMWEFATFVLSTERAFSDAGYDAEYLTMYELNEGISKLYIHLLERFSGNLSDALPELKRQTAILLAIWCKAPFDKLDVDLKGETTDRDALMAIAMNTCPEDIRLHILNRQLITDKEIRSLVNMFTI